MLLADYVDTESAAERFTTCMLDFLSSYVMVGFIQLVILGKP